LETNQSERLLLICYTPGRWHTYFNVSYIAPFGRVLKRKIPAMLTISTAHLLREFVAVLLDVVTWWWCFVNCVVTYCAPGAFHCSDVTGHLRALGQIWFGALPFPPFQSIHPSTHFPPLPYLPHSFADF